LLPESGCRMLDRAATCVLTCGFLGVSDGIRTHDI
jgi:hypothetical protein